MMKTSSFLVLLALLLFGAGCTNDSVPARLAAAKQHLAKREAAAAVIELKNAIAQDTNSAEARFLLGKALLETAQPAAAAIELRKALELKHPSVQVLPELARSMFRAMEFKALIDQFGGTGLDDAAALADLKTSLASAHMALGQRAEAEQALQAALASDPAHPSAQNLQARWLAAKGDFAGANALIAKVLAAHPADAAAWTTDGDLRRAGPGDRAPALASYRKAIELDRYNLAAHAGAIEILLAGEDTEALRKQLGAMKAVAPGHPQTHYFQARLALRGDDLPAARSALQQALRLVPDHLQALELAGVVELRLGFVAQAQAFLAAALKQAPYNRPTRRLLAQTLLQQDRPAEALAVLEPALGPTADARTLALAGRAYLQAGDARRAEAAFARATRIDPDDTSSRTALAVGAIGRGEVEAGTHELEKLAAMDPGTSADMALISSLLLQRKFDAALRAVDALESKAENKAAVANLRGRTQLLMRDERGAVASFEKALAIQPGFFPAAASLASLDLAQGKPDEARKRFEAVLRVEPKHVPALLALADLAARSGASAKEVERLIQSAVETNPDDPAAQARLIGHQLQMRQPKQALATAQRVLARLPATPELQDALGRAQLAAGEANQAADTYRKLTALRPTVAQFHARLAEALLAVNNLDTARDSLKQALKIKPDLLDAQVMLAMLDASGRRTQDALALARQVQKQRPGQAVGLVLEGDIEAMQHRPEAAASAYRKALKIAPDPKVAVSLHAALRKANQTAEAARFADDWLKLHPRDARFIFHLGDEARRRGELGEAEARYRDTLAITPDNYLALNNLAWTIVRQGKAGATEYAEKAIRLRPDDPLVLGTLAMSLAQERQFDRAIEAQSRVVQLQPQVPLLKLDLARLYIAAGRKEQARATLEELAALGDGFPGRDEVRRLRGELAGG